jgi:hypothetical protein
VRTATRQKRKTAALEEAVDTQEEPEDDVGAEPEDNDTHEAARYMIASACQIECHTRLWKQVIVTPFTLRRRQAEQDYFEEIIQEPSNPISGSGFTDIMFSQACLASATPTLPCFARTYLPIAPHLDARLW